MSDQPENTPDVGTLTFEAALRELEGIVERLEAGDIGLEESIATYERGQALKERCDTLLQAAEARVEKIALKTDGTASGTAPLDVDDG